MTYRNPVHVNFKYRTTIRNKECLKLLKRAIVNCRKYGLRVIHFSLLDNHIHVIAEATDNDTLTRGMRSLTITFAKGLKKGKVQIERYHLHVLKGIRETKNAINYVLFNKQKHERRKVSQVDEYSSLLLLDNAVAIIRNFTRAKKITLRMNRVEEWNLEKAVTYLAKMAMRELTGP